MTKLAGYVAVLISILSVWALAGLPAQAQKTPERVPDTDAKVTAKSNALEQHAAPLDLNAGPYLASLSEIKAYAESFTNQLPLPEPDSLDDIGLVAAADQGGTSAALLEFVMLHNLRCDWYQVALGTTGSTLARVIIDDIPNWGPFKASSAGAEIGQRSRRIAEGVQAGRDDALRAEVSGPACNPVAARRAIVP